MRKNIFIIATLVAGFGVVVLGYRGNAVQKKIGIGVVTPLTGDVAYWGESSKIGMQLAEKDLKEEGIENVAFFIEDGNIDPKTALSAAQKLIAINNVDAIYSEFPAAAQAITSFVKDKKILHIYSDAVVAPLGEGQFIYRTYISHQEGCKKAAEILKKRNIGKVGLLKIKLENGDLCLAGIKEVYGDDVVAALYDPGNKDFRSQLLKLKSENVNAVFNVGYQPETLASIKQLRELKMNAVFVGLSEVVSPDIVSQYEKILEGSIMFGLPAVSDDFIAKVDKEFPDVTVGDYHAVALTYLHTKQLGRAFSKCSKDLECVKKELDNAKPDQIIGFGGFKQREAEFTILVQEWSNGKFINILQ